MSMTLSGTDGINSPAGVKFNNVPAFDAYLPTTDQSITAGVATKVTLSAENFDTNSNFDTSTYRFTPTVAGYYQITGSIYHSSNGTRPTAAATYIYKNGANVALSGLNIATANSIVGSVSVTRVIYLNGSTDYVELYGLQTGGTSNIFTAGTTFTFLTGTLVRAA